MPSVATITREAWAWDHDRCFICGSRAGCDVHEIARGPHRKSALDDPAAWLKVCPGCHCGVLDSMPVARQLAYKMIGDPKHYDRQRVNVLRRRQPDAITEREVAIEVAEVFKLRDRGW